MTESLNNLSEEEFKIISQVRILKGDIKSIEIELEKLNIPNRYHQIYEDYIDFYNRTMNLEALKRIIFIQWYSASEPIAFTGIGELKNELQLENLKSLEKLIYDQSLDSEFKIMINHYYSVSSWYFDSFFKFSELLKFISKYTQTRFIFSVDNRGQMGEYWGSLKK